MQYAKVEIMIPMVQESEVSAPCHCAGDFYDHCKDLVSLAQEMFVVFTLTQKNEIINRHIVHVGSLSESLVHPREVFRRALLDNAAAVSFAHNHPSGDTTPSRADRQLTQRLKECADLLGIYMLDHLIVGKDKYHSFAECGAL